VTVGLKQPQGVKGAGIAGFGGFEAVGQEAETVEVRQATVGDCRGEFGQVFFVIDGSVKAGSVAVEQEIIFKPGRQNGFLIIDQRIGHH